ncbi:MAG TPA: NAD-dependent epimerase/dehydratase family protein [Gemmatimonadaceae bacterium]
MSRAQTILVTGATGFLGCNVCEHFVRNGSTVRALLRSRNAHVLRDTVPIVAADLNDRDSLCRALQCVDTVVHLAARVHVMRDTTTDPLAEFRRVNVDGTRALLEAAIAQGVQRFVFVSSVKAMGESADDALTEEMHAAPSDPYGVSKLEAEQLVSDMARAAGIHAPILRLPLVYGAGMKANMLRLFDLVDRGFPFPLGRVQNKRSLAYVGNVVHAIRAVLGSPAAAHETFFVSDGEDVSTPELIRLIARSIGKPARLLPVPVSLMRAAGRVGDLLATVAPVPLSTPVLDRLLGSLTVDSSKLRRITGYVPPFSVAEGMHITGQWYRTERT